MKLSAVIVLSFLIAVQAGAGWGMGWCPKPALQPNFDITRYLGTWYEAARVKNIQFESGDCVTAQYSLNPNNTVKVVNSQYKDSGYTSMEGVAYCEASKSGQCYVKFSANQPWGDYEVVATDYQTYSIVYSCTNLYLAHYSIAWVLARDSTFDPTVAVQSLAALGLDQTDFYFTRQTDCPSRFGF